MFKSNKHFRGDLDPRTFYFAYHFFICSLSANAAQSEFSARNCRVDVVAAVKAGLDMEGTHHPCWDAALQQAANKRSMFYKQLSQYNPKLQSAIIEFLEIKADKKKVSRHVLLSLEEEMKRDVVDDPSCV